MILRTYRLEGMERSPFNAACAEIERDSATKQGAIAAIFDASAAGKAKRPATSPSERRSRGQTDGHLISSTAGA